MKGDPTVSNWHRKIIADAEGTLGRGLTEVERAFVTSRGGFVALETIRDTVTSAGREERARYLNAEAPRRGGGEGMA